MQKKIIKQTVFSLAVTSNLVGCVGAPSQTSSSMFSSPSAISASAVSSANTSSQSVSSLSAASSSIRAASSSLTISSSLTASSSATLTPSPTNNEPGQALLGSTGTFNDGQESFSAITQGANNSVSWNRKVIFNVIEEQTNPWDIQLLHPIAVDAGLRITVCFRALANQSRAIKVDIDSNAPSYQSLAYGGEEIILTPQMQAYSLSFDIAQTSNDARLAFNLGGEIGSITFDDIAVYTGNECVTPTNSSSAASSSSPSASGTNNAAPSQPSYASAGTGGKIGSATSFPCPGCLIGTPSNYDHSKATPLLITLHGDEGKADFIHNRYYTRDGIAKKAGFIVASLKCPDSLACDNTNNTSTLNNFRAKNSWWLWERYETQYDKEWINRQVDKIEEKYNIDRRKIYFAGFSGGSVLLSTWGFENSDRYAGMILSGGGAVAKTYRNCVSKCPMPVYISIGKEDSLHKSATLTRDQAEKCGHEVEFSEHAGVGHIYIQSDLNKIMQWFLDRPHQCID